MAPRRLFSIAAALVAAASLCAATADAAKPIRTARFAVVSLKGRQTSTWNLTTRSSPECAGEVHESGRQTISFKQTRRARLTVRLYRSGRHKFALGNRNVRTAWTFRRSYSRSTTGSTCPAALATAAESYDCGRQGPFRVPMSLSYRGSFELGGKLNGLGSRGPHYRTCGFEGFHEMDLLDGEAPVSRSRVFNRSHKTFPLRFFRRRTESLAGGDGHQTTTLRATLTLRRR